MDGRLEVNNKVKNCLKKLKIYYEVEEEKIYCIYFDFPKNIIWSDAIIDQIQIIWNNCHHLWIEQRKNFFGKLINNNLKTITPNCLNYLINLLTPAVFIGLMNPNGRQRKIFDLSNVINRPDDNPELIGIIIDVVKLDEQRIAELCATLLENHPNTLQFLYSKIVSANNRNHLWHKSLKLHNSYVIEFMIKEGHPLTTKEYNQLIDHHFHKNSQDFKKLLKWHKKGFITNIDKEFIYKLLLQTIIHSKHELSDMLLKYFEFPQCLLDTNLLIKSMKN